MLMLKVPLIYNLQPLTGFDICWVTSHRASGLEKSTSPPHIPVAQVPYQCLSSPISPCPWQYSFAVKDLNAFNSQATAVYLLQALSSSCCFKTSLRNKTILSHQSSDKSYVNVYES